MPNISHTHVLRQTSFFCESPSYFLSLKNDRFNRTKVRTLGPDLARKSIYSIIKNERTCQSKRIFSREWRFFETAARRNARIASKGRRANV